MTPMMGLLRSRKTMLVLVGLIIVGMVATGAVGVISSLNSPSPEEQQEPSAQAEAPSLQVLGDPSAPLTYVDLGQECQQQPGQAADCFRTVGLDAGGEELSAEEALSSARGDLEDSGWQEVVPEGAEDEELPEHEYSLTDGESIVMASSVPHGDAVPASLVLFSVT